MTAENGTDYKLRGLQLLVQPLVLVSLAHRQPNPLHLCIGFLAALQYVGSCLTLQHGHFWLLYFLQ